MQSYKLNMCVCVCVYILYIYIYIGNLELIGLHAENSTSNYCRLKTEATWSNNHLIQAFDLIFLI